MDLKITDGERARYTEIYGTDPLASDGWIVKRIRHDLEVLGCEIGEPFDLLEAPAGETIEAPAMRGSIRVIVQIENQRIADASTFRVLVKWS